MYAYPCNVFFTPMFQYPLRLFDCNENKTQELIALLKKLSNEYIPYKNDNIVEPVFFGGISFLCLIMSCNFNDNE